MKKNQQEWSKDRKTNEVIVCCLCFTIITMSILADISVLPLHEWIVIKVENVEDLFFTLFTVQASIATVSIAIISIITGLTNESIFGVSVSAYIAEIKPIFLKHKRVIIFNIGLTMINYACVALRWYNLSISLFVISTILTVVLVKDVYMIFRGRQRIEEEIHTYILSNYDVSYLSDLNAEMLNAVDAGNTLVLKKDIEIILEIFENETRDSGYKGTEITNLILNTTADLFKKVVAQHNSARTNGMLQVICRIYEIANQNEVVSMKLNLWENISYDFFRGVGDLSYEQLTEEYICNRIHRALYKNLQGQKISSSRTGLVYYSARLYTIISHNNNLFSKDQVFDLVRSMYENTTGMLYYRLNNLTDDDTTVLVSEICYLNKVLIDKGDCKIIKEYFFNRCGSYSRGKPKHELIFVVTLIYLYYLACREKDQGTAELQENARNILNENKKRITYFWMHMDLATFIENNHGFIQNLMHDWEYMEEFKAKWVQMEYIIDDFFVLAGINRFWDKESLKRIIRNITDGSMFSLYNRYYSSRRENYPEELDKEFCVYFTTGNNTQRDMYKYEALLDVCNACYKEEQLEEAQKNQLTEAEKNKFAEESMQCIPDYVASTFSCFAFDPVRGDEDITKINGAPIMTLISSNSLFKDDELSAQIKDFYYGSLMQVFLYEIRKNVDFERIDFESKNKQSRLIELVEKAGVQGTVAIGNREEFWDEENQELLLEYTKQMQRIEHPEGYNHFYILDGRQIEFSCDNVTITFEDLSDEEIGERCRRNKDGTISYNVTNDLYIPFEESELKDFVHRTWKKIKVSVDIKYRLANQKVGAGIEITTD